MTTVSTARHLRPVHDLHPASSQFSASQDRGYRHQIHQHAQQAARQLDRDSLDRWALRPQAQPEDATTQEAILLTFADVWHREGREILGRDRFMGRNVTREQDRTDIQNRAMSYVLEDYRPELAEDHAGVTTTAVVRDFLSRQIGRATAAQSAQRRRAEERFSSTGWGDPRRPDSIHGLMENQTPGASAGEYPVGAIKPPIEGMCSAVTPPAPPWELEPGTAAAADTSSATPEDPLDPRTFPDNMAPPDKIIRVEEEQRLDHAITQMARRRDLVWKRRASVLKAGLDILRGGFVWPATSRKLNRPRPLVPGDFRAKLRHAAGVKWRADFHRLVAPLESWLVERVQ